MADPDRLTHLTREDASEAVAILRRVLDALPTDDSMTASGEQTKASREDATLRQRLQLAVDLHNAGQGGNQTGV